MVDVYLLHCVLQLCFSVYFFFLIYILFTALVKFLHNKLDFECFLELLKRSQKSTKGFAVTASRDDTLAYVGYVAMGTGQHVMFVPAFRNAPTNIRH